MYKVYDIISKHVMKAWSEIFGIKSQIQKIPNKYMDNW